VRVESSSSSGFPAGSSIVSTLHALRARGGALERDRESRQRRRAHPRPHLPVAPGRLLVRLGPIVRTLLPHSSGIERFRYHGRLQGWVRRASRPVCCGGASGSSIKGVDRGLGFGSETREFSRMPGGQRVADAWHMAAASTVLRWAAILLFGLALVPVASAFTASNTGRPPARAPPASALHRLEHHFVPPRREPPCRGLVRDLRRRERPPSRVQLSKGTACTVCQNTAGPRCVPDCDRACGRSGHRAERRRPYQ